MSKATKIVLGTVGVSLVIAAAMVATIAVGL
ncbi:hypothetical protein [Halovenus sp. HT40]